MTSSQPPSQNSDPHQQDDRPLSDQVSFEAEIENVERSLQALKERYTQVQQDQQRQSHLQQRLEEVKQLQTTSSPELKLELKQIQDQLDALEVNLESRLFSWGSLQEIFWQIVRFGGLGVVVGWLLAFATINSPKPNPSSVPNPVPTSSTRP